MADENRQVPPRADKAAFRTFMGAVLFIACIPLALWAYWSFSAYQQTVDHTQTMAERSDVTKTIAERERETVIRTSLANRYRLEAALSGIGSLILFGGSMLLFVLAINARKIKQQFVRVNWQQTPLPQGRIQVQYRRLFDLFAIFLIVFFGSLMILLLWTNGIRIVSVIIVALIAFFLCVFLFLIIRAKRKAVSVLDENGIMRGDGRQFPWGEFQGLITEIDFTRVAKQRYLWRIKLAFENGEEGWIIPYRVKNEEDVFQYLAALPRARTASER